MALKLVGVDGCRAGWVVAASDRCPDGSMSLTTPSFSIMRTFGELLDQLGDGPAVVAVDIPIGLPSGYPRDTGRRRADREARAFLGAQRAASVFSAPCRSTLAATAYREACDLEVQARGEGKGLSQQAYRIIPKIRDVDAVMQPSRQQPLGDNTGIRIHEVHPEVVFAALAGDGQPRFGLVHAKRGCASCREAACPGESDRLSLLRPYLPGFEPREVRRRLLREYPREREERGPVVGRDDTVDAAACLVAALRIARGDAMTLPSGAAEYDARGLRMEIVG